ncbi:putative ABC transporter ATP-binding protein YheS [Salinivirga cyanobacteriivorans]|uniref:Probable ATP-binding protein YbiT n=1 Tax=Salinivirga cyanobacteriivorans TaxID=1307839 RepID=A0A0S2HYP7_9BACT|nr:ABC-F family ATP-binding cassette domain-containing protein [Salinivirga cyanobacteriivorans]ALO15110.1 putative ABC transporter ATP-binding protein YheS [Salinivirga cyanobacteriivorans]
MIALNDITIRFDGEALFEKISFKVNPKNRIGLAGRNGAGKSTILKVIAGLQDYDEGQLAISKDTSIGYLPQHMQIADTQTVMEETLTAFEHINELENEIAHLNKAIAERYDYESDEYMELITRVTDKNERYQMMDGDKRIGFAEQTLAGLGFESKDLKRPTSEFSGGWRMRIELAKILLQQPDVLLLDEPTNHLDIESISWLEDLLKNYRGAVIMVSHDRFFLDAITNRTIEISLGQIYDYPVPYTEYTKLMKERREQQKAAYENQQKKIKETEEFIEKFRYKATKAVQVQSRVKMLEKMERIEIDDMDSTVMNLRFPPAPRAGDIVIDADDVGKHFGDHEVFSNANFTIERGEKISFVGKNGEGKTTLVRIIMKEIEHEGKLKTGHNVKIGYYAQNQPEQMNPNKTVFETIDDLATGDMRTKTRDILGSFLFGGEDIDKKVSVLSGGERARLAIACMLLNPINLLVMDEPTHHLDMYSKDVLKKALKNFDGTLIIISHDRYFLEGLTQKTYEFREKRVIEHLGGIEEFIRKRKLERLNELNTTSGIKSKSDKASSDNANASNKDLYAARKTLDKDIRKAEKKATEMEQAITDYEKAIEAVNEKMADPEKAEYEKDSNELKTLEQKLSEAMENWEAALQNVEMLKEKREALK